MPPGYHGCYLRIDVSTGRADRVPLSETLLRRYIGGSGLGTRLLLDEGGAAVDPLAPEAPLVFAFSPLVGTPLTTSAKFAVVSRSPLTDRLNDSLAGSGFALAGKHCGCDAIVIVGADQHVIVAGELHEADRIGVLGEHGLDLVVEIVDGELFIDREREVATVAREARVFELADLEAARGDAEP